MRPFAGFKRKAVVVLPTDKVFRERIDKRTKEEGKEVPETAVLEMKGRTPCREMQLIPLYIVEWSVMCSAGRLLSTPRQEYINSSSNIGAVCWVRSVLQALLTHFTPVFFGGVTRFSGLC